MLSYFIYKWFNKNWGNKIALIGILIIWTIITYNIYTAIYPNDDFYENEFKTITLMEFPKSGIIINSTASYPDFHGDYCSSAEIKLSKKDYEKILDEIINNKIFTRETSYMNSEESMYIMKDIKEEDIQYIFIRKDEKKLGLDLNINFQKDNRTIFINICQL